MSICNESKIIKKDAQSCSALGAPTEAALKVVVEKLGAYDTQFKGWNPEEPMSYNNYIAETHKKFATLEFTRDRKAMSVIV